MESLNALLQGMGLMHLGAGQAIMLLVSLLLLWLAIAKKFEPLLLLPIGFGGLLSNIPEAGMALTALESLLAHHDAGQLAVIAAKLNCAPDVHAIKEALALALPSVQGQMENLAVDMGYTPGVLALFYKVAIGSGVAPLVIFMGVGAMTDFGPLLANPRTLLLGAASQFGIFATVLGALTLNYFGLISFTLPQAAAIGIIGAASGSSRATSMSSTTGKRIFSRLLTVRSCTMRSFRSVSLVSAFIIGGWINGPSAIYEYAAPALAPSRSGARLPAR